MRCTSCRMRILPENHKELQIPLGGLLQQVLRPGKRARALQPLYLELVLADQLGFDAVVVNEHHNTVYSMMATPNLIAAALIPQTKNARICVWGTPPNLMLPNRLAEEYAMLDVMSNGRLEVAFPLGTGMEYWANPVNPATARDKYRESLEIILQAWSEDGPTPHYGTHYTYRFLNPWPRPMQRPHPPCYIVGTGSPETIEIAAELGFGYASVFVTTGARPELNEKLRQRAAHYGHTLRPDQFPILTFVYVAETRSRPARIHGAPAGFFEDFVRTTPQSRAARLSLGRAAQDPRGRRRQDAWRLRLRRAQQSFFIAVGTPDKVANEIGEWTAWMKTNHINSVMHVADMPHWKTVKNLTCSPKR